MSAQRTRPRETVLEVGKKGSRRRPSVATTRLVCYGNKSSVKSLLAAWRAGLRPNSITACGHAKGTFAQYCQVFQVYIGDIMMIEIFRNHLGMSWPPDEMRARQKSSREDGRSR